jgi:signal recognition particle subunit SRP54
MTGQDAVTTAERFHETLTLDGVILTKLDGDARGGAALSVKEVVGKPIAFASTGEKVEDFDLFHPDRLAGRILGMGDMLTLIEKAEGAFEKEAAEEAATKLLDGTFTLDDFLEQMQQIKKMGPLNSLVALMPGVPKELKDAEIDDRELARVEAIIRSMTTEERTSPEIIDGSRRSRIASGSGMQPGDVSNLIKQFKQMQKMLNNMGGMGTKALKKGKGKKGKKGKKSKKGRPDGGPTALDEKRPKGPKGRKSGGRVTPKGGNKKPLVLPGLDEENPFGDLGQPSLG